MAVPVYVNLFGPNQASGSLTQAIGSTFAFVGSALTTSTKTFNFSLVYPSLVAARFMAIWTPNSTASWVRLVHMDDGPTNITEIAAVQSNGSTTPIVTAVDITNAMNTLITNKVNKHIGFQLKDDGVTAWTLYEVRLELNFS